jgi:DNA-binding NarL/FixJ family response regulator
MKGRYFPRNRRRLKSVQAVDRKARHIFGEPCWGFGFLSSTTRQRSEAASGVFLSQRKEWVVCGEAADGVEAIAKTKSLCPDVVLMDIAMPGIDGIEAARLLSREAPGSKIVIVSQNDPGVVRRQAQDAGAAGYIAKSVLALELVATLEKLFL